MKQIPSPITLSELQNWMRWVITDPRGVHDALINPRPVTLEYPERYLAPEPSAYSSISMNADLSVETRLSVYAEAYFSRLLESLEVDFKRLRLVMGELEFQILISEYLKAHPSKSFNIGEVGRHLPEFLKTKHPESCFIEIADFEFRLIESFYSVDVPLLSPKAFESLSEDDWANLKLEIDPSVEVLTSFWPLDEFWGLENETPESMFTKTKSERHFLLWRKLYQVQFREITQLEAEALRLLKDGISLSQALEHIEEKFSKLGRPDTLSEQVMSCFGRWMSDAVISNFIT